MESINEEILKSYGITATVLDVCESTNEHALINGGVVFARTQSGGRGRNGRNFYSGEGGIYTSIAFDVIDEKINVQGSRIPFSPASLTVSAGCAVCKLLIGYGFDASIKWVNDVFVASKKVCGILAERRGDRVVIGIGIDYASELPDSLKDIAAPLFSEADGINLFAAELYRKLYCELSACDYDYYKSHCFTIGKYVSTCNGEGVAEDIEDGCLVVKTEKGRIKVFSGEAVILKN